MLPAMHLMAFSQASSLPTARMDPIAAQQMFQQGLFRAQARVFNVWEADTIQRRNKAMQELDHWLQQLPATWCKTLLNCTPADLVVYLESHWLAHHMACMLVPLCPAVPR